jgi:hypothetical protein
MVERGAPMSSGRECQKSVYEIRKCTAFTRKDREKFLNEAYAEGWEYVGGLQEGIDPRPTLASPREVIFRRTEAEPAGPIEGPSVLVLVNGTIVKEVPISVPPGDGPHRVVTQVQVGEDKAMASAIFDVGDEGVHFGVHAETGSPLRRAFHDFLFSNIRYSPSSDNAPVGAPSTSPEMTSNDLENGRREMAKEIVAAHRPGWFPKLEDLKSEFAEQLRPGWFPKLEDIPGPVTDYVLALEKLAENWIVTAAQYVSNEAYWRERCEKAEKLLYSGSLGTQR